MLNVVRHVIFVELTVIIVSLASLFGPGTVCVPVSSYPLDIFCQIVYAKVGESLRVSTIVLREKRSLRKYCVRLEENASIKYAVDITVFRLRN